MVLGFLGDGFGCRGPGSGISLHGSGSRRVERIKFGVYARALFCKMREQVDILARGSHEGGFLSFSEGVLVGL